jgi:hypothetical protein
MKVYLKSVCCLLAMTLATGCVQVRTGNDVVDATSAVATGVYLQKKIDAQQAKSGKPDIFKTTDPKVKDIDAAIAKARSRQQPAVMDKSAKSAAGPAANPASTPAATSN